MRRMFHTLHAPRKSTSRKSARAKCKKQVLSFDKLFLLTIGCVMLIELVWDLQGVWRVLVPLFQHNLSGAMTMRCNFPVVGFTHNIC